MDYIEKIIDVSTGEVIEVPYNEEQLRIAKEYEKRDIEYAAIAAAKEAARKAIFDKLGITEEEAKLLLS